MKIEEFRKVIHERILCHDEWYQGIEKCWDKEIEILAEDIQSTIDFLNNDCTADEYSWISEIIDDLAEKTMSKELIDCYKNLMLKFPEECKKYNIAGSIEFAEDILNQEEEDDKKD
ncbi:MAG: hypothetical protein IJ224_05915 [Lachnospiraceae bacterium]|nr:hypothetical protein [Lachnospiraceae bacterium]